jgi:predicted GIY-YIG superfamily endonuclease
MKKKYLYLLQHQNIPEYTKIGFTTDIEKRIKSLQTASPTGVKVIYLVESDYAYKLEQALHKRYSSKNSNLEWFKLTASDIEDIISWIEKQKNRKIKKK